MRRYMAATLTCSVLSAGPTDPAVSEQGRFIADQIDESWRSYQVDSASGIAQAFGELADLAEECSAPDWDGYGAVPLSSDAVSMAGAFLQSLPIWIRSPSLGADPDGHVAFEWSRSRSRVVSVSVGADGYVYYAALIGAAKVSGAEPFLGECSERIIELIDQVYLV